jgi:hypothetical protein
LTVTENAWSGLPPLKRIDWANWLRYVVAVTACRRRDDRLAAAA